MSALTDKQADTIYRGDDIHHPKLNLTGMALSVDGNEVVVMTTAGKQTWNISDIEKLDTWN